MPLITAELLQSLLEPAADSEKVKAGRMSYADKGPGYLDKWASVLEGKDNCWQKREAGVSQRKQKKKIVISSDALTDALPIVDMQALINALIEHYDVYLWPGEKVNIDTLKPLNNSAEFWQKRSATVITHQRDIKKVLATQGIATANYLFLDYAGCHDLFNKLNDTGILKKYISDPTAMHHGEIAAAGIDLEKVTIAYASPADKILTDISHYPQLETLEIFQVNDDCFQNKLTQIKGKNLNIKLTDSTIKSLECFDNDFKQLRILGGNVSDLVIKNNSPQQLSSLHGLELLVLSSDSLSKIDLSQCTKLSELAINECGKLLFTSDLLPPSVKKLHLTDTYVIEFGACEASKLEQFECVQGHSLKLIDFSTYKSLKIVKIKDCEELSEIKFADPNDIEELDLSGIKDSRVVEQINFKAFKNLKKLTIDSIPITSLDLSSLSKMEELNISNCTLSVPLDISACKKLKQINFDQLKFDYKEGEISVQLGELSELNQFSIKHSHIYNLDLSRCQNLESFISNNDTWNTINLNDLAKLKKIDIKIFDLDEVGRIFLNNGTSITDLNVERFTTNKKIINLATLPNIENLLIINASKLQLQIISNMAKLKSLNIYSFHNAQMLDLTRLKNLKNLKIESDDILENMDTLLISELDALCIQEFRKLQQIDLGRLGKIKSLEIVSCVALKSLNIDAHSQVQELKIIQSELSELKCQNSNNLKRLFIKGNISLELLELKDLAELEEIELEHCQNLQSLFIANCPKLKRLIIKNCPSFVGPTDIHAAQLEVLEIKECNAVTSTDFTTMPHLKSLEFKIPIPLQNEPFKQINGFDLQLCPDLESLNIGGCYIPDLNCQNHSRLKQINITDATMASINLGGASQLKKLEMEVTNVSINPEFETMINLASCSSLQSLSLNQEHKITVNNLEDCSQLKTAQLTLGSQDEINAIEMSVPAKCKVYQYLRSSYAEPQPVQVNDESMQNNRRNKLNPVSRFTMMSSEHGIDARTKQSTEEYSAYGDFTVEFIGQEIADRHGYRIFIKDTVQFKDGRILFSTNIKEKLNKEPVQCQALTQDDLQKIINQAKSNPFASAAYFTGKLVPGEIYPLPSNAAKTEEHYKNNIFSIQHDKIDLFWHPEHQQYYVKLKPEVAQITDVELIHLSNNNLEYQYSPHATRPAVTNTPEQLLPDDIISYFNTAISFTPELKFLVSPISQEQKLLMLVEYCSKFKNEALSRNTHDDMDTILACIIEQKGSCRHRSNAFMLLARFIGVPVRIVTNEKHAYCEIPFPADPLSSDNAMQWYSVDFGGAEVLDLTPESQRQSVLDKITKQPAIISDGQAAPDIKKQTIHAQHVANYLSRFDKLVEKTELDSVAAMLADQTGLAPLFELSAQQTPFAVNQQIIQQLQTSGFDTRSNYLFINSANDFKLLLIPYSLKDGKREKIAGPLQRLIEQGGIISVNWANFSHTELASYKSILDNPPTLLGKTVSKNLTVIGLTAEQTEACTAFSSRCKTYKLNDTFFKPQPERAATAQISAQADPVDLFESANWKEKLLGKITFKGDQIILADGPLLQAIQENKPIPILNPPKNDPDFALLLHRLETEKQFLYNGEMKAVPDNFTFTLDTKAHVNALENVTIAMDKSVDQPRLQRIYVGLYNIHECIDQLIIDKAHNAYTADGFLALFDSNQHEFYITESIPRSDWQFLLAQIAEKYPDKQFKFVLAPGVSIEGVAENTTEINHSVSGFMVSNDPNYLAQRLVEGYAKQDHSAMIVDITPQTDFNNLIAEMTIERSNDSSKVKFNYQEKEILHALIQGKTVVLNGALTPALYQQLLPLFSTPARIYSNGQYREITGQLISVQPLAAKENLPGLPYQQKAYKLADYQNAFPPEDADYLAQIFAFYAYAEKLPHKGAGTPTSPELSYDRLKQMVQVLKTRPLHAQNPIKGLFHYDYLIGSEDYYYLNVMAKYQFSNNVTRALREQKLIDILNRYNINDPADLKNHLWKILNCFSGAEIKQLLGDDLSQAMNNSSTYPILNSFQLAEIWHRIQPYVFTAYQKTYTTKQSHVAKREAQLSALLADETTNIIVLKGPPGVGKTHTIRAVLNISEGSDKRVYEGEKGIIDWLDKGDKILLLDEANLAVPGTWDFLAGVQRGNKVIYYQGKEYKLKPNHQKVIATINPENYPKREYQKILQHQAETIRFEMPEPDFLEKNVLAIILNPHGLNEPHYNRAILKAYELIRAANPTYVFSNRDLESLALRFIAIVGSERDMEKNMISLWRACVGEFAGTLIEAPVRAAFVQRLANEFNIDPLQSMPQKEFITLSAKCKIHPEKAQFIESLEQDVLIRQQYLAASATPAQKSLSNFKRGILIEGDAGLGKSTLLKALLEKNGFSADAANTQQRYYEISAGDENNAATILLKAFHEGSAVILDEINLDESLEKLLNQLLSGVDLDGKPAKKEGFMIFSSQNPSYFAGRQSVSQAMRNRMHMIYMESYSKSALIDIAKAWNIEQPEAFVDAFLQCKKANMRTYYTLLASPDIPKIKPELHIEAINTIEINSGMPLEMVKTGDASAGSQLYKEDLLSKLRNPPIKGFKDYIEKFGEKFSAISSENPGILTQYQKNLVTCMIDHLKPYFAGNSIANHSMAQTIYVIKALATVLDELAKENNQFYLNTNPQAKEVSHLFKEIIQNWPNVKGITVAAQGEDGITGAVLSKMQALNENPLIMTSRSDEPLLKMLDELKKNVGLGSHLRPNEHLAPRSRS